MNEEDLVNHLLNGVKPILDPLSLENTLLNIKNKFSLGSSVLEDNKKENLLYFIENNKDYARLSNFLYKKDQFGFRNERLDLDSDTLVFGCSVTYGVGVPQECIWHSLLKNKLGLKITNFGICGISNSSIVKNCLSITKFFKPKNVLILFPEYTRELLCEDISNPEFFNSFPNFDKVWPQDRKKLAVSKTYYKLPLIYFADKFISDLEILCLFFEKTETNLLISSWDFYTQLMIKQTVKNYKNCKVVNRVRLDNLGRDFLHPGTSFHNKVSQEFERMISK